MKRNRSSCDSRVQREGRSRRDSAPLIAFYLMIRGGGCWVFPPFSFFFFYLFPQRFYLLEGGAGLFLIARLVF